MESTSVSVVSAVADRWRYGFELKVEDSIVEAEVVCLVDTGAGAYSLNSSV